MQWELSDQEVEDGWRLRRLAWGHLPPLAFQAACRHDVFSQLEASGPQTPAQLASELGLNEPALALLLEAMAALELLEVEQGRYSNAPISSRMLVKGKPLCQLDIILRKQVDGNTVEHSEQVLKNGHFPALAAVPHGNLEDVLAATRQSALLSVAKLVRAAPPAAGERLLDVAGAPGIYSIGYASSQSDLQAVILELPGVAEAVRQALPPELRGRIQVLEGDMHQLSWQPEYSTVLLSNVIHFVREEQLDPLLARLAGALQPGGRMLIHDSLRGDDGKGPLLQSLLALLIMSLSPGVAFTRGRVQESLQRAGLQVDNLIDMAPEPGCLVVARKA